MATKIKLIADNVITTSQIDTSSLDSHFTGGTGVTYSSGTISIGQAVHSTDSPTFADLTLTGNLNITGDINSYNVTDLDVTDQTITLGAGQTEALSGGSGIIVDGSGASILWDETNDTFDINKGLNVDSDTFVVDNTNNRVGIGKSNPSQSLDIIGRVYTSSNEDINMDGSANGHLRIDGAGYAAALALNTTGLNIYTNSASRSIIFGINETEAMRIDSSGNVGIGTSVPSYKLSLQDNSTSAYPLVLENGNIGTAGVHTGIRFGYSGNTYQKGAIIFEGQDASGRGKMYFSMEGTADNSNADETDAKLTIDYSGNVCVGTTNDGAPGLTISDGRNLSFGTGNDNESYVNFFRQSSSAAAVMATGYRRSSTSNLMESSIGSSWAKAAVAANYGTIRFYTDSASADAVGTDLTPTERMRIDESGNVQIGGVNHQNLSGSTKELTIGTTGDTSNDGGGISFTHNSVLGSYILGQKGAMTIAHYVDGSDIIFRTNEGGTNADRVRITGDGGGGALLVGGETSMDTQVLDGTGSAGALYIGNTARSYPVIAMVSQHRKWLSHYVTNDGSLRTYDSVANHETQITDTSGRVTFPKQPHILFSPRYSGGSGYANTHNENTSYSRGTLSTTVVGGYARITVPVAGLYLVTFNTICDTGTGRMDTAIAVNGGAVTTGLNDTNTSGFHYRSHAITLDLAANDYLTFSNDDWYDAASNAYTTWRNVSVTLIG